MSNVWNNVISYNCATATIIIKIENKDIKKLNKGGEGVQQSFLFSGIPAQFYSYGLEHCHRLGR